MDENGPTPKMVAEWMAEQLAEHKSLDQESVFHQIREQFGEEFARQHDDGGLSIDKRVIQAFAKLTGDDVVWEPGNLRWTYREPFHRPGRMQD